MQRVEPQVFLVGEPTMATEGLKAYLNYVGAPSWIEQHSDPTATGAESLPEIMGRVCYRSWEPGLNANVTKVRRGNNAYLKNILDVKHGSVLEHSWLNFIFAGVSRVFTHEAVRHRAGVRDEDAGQEMFYEVDPAVSQESLRFVRLTDLKLWLPSCLAKDSWSTQFFEEKFKLMEVWQKELFAHFDLDNPDKNFNEKKEITSALRRLAPMGLATDTGWSGNIRAIRWCLEARTSPTAEEEIRVVYGQVGEIILKRYPNLFQDFEIETIKNLPWYKPKNSKI